MEFVTGFLILTHWEAKSYDSILVIVKRFTKTIHYKPFKITIDILDLAKMIINVVIHYHRVLGSIVTD